jgi:hypothetical protein
LICSNQLESTIADVGPASPFLNALWRIKHLTSDVMGEVEDDEGTQMKQDMLLLEVDNNMRHARRRSQGYVSGRLEERKVVNQRMSDRG